MPVLRTVCQARVQCVCPCIGDRDLASRQTAPMVAELARRGLSAARPSRRNAGPHGIPRPPHTLRVGRPAGKGTIRSRKSFGTRRLRAGSRPGVPPIRFSARGRLAAKERLALPRPPFRSLLGIHDPRSSSQASTRPCPPDPSEIPRIPTCRRDAKHIDAPIVLWGLVAGNDEPRLVEPFRHDGRIGPDYPLIAAGSQGTRFHQVA